MGSACAPCMRRWRRCRSRCSAAARPAPTPTPSRPCRRSRPRTAAWRQQQRQLPALGPAGLPPGRDRAPRLHPAAATPLRQQEQGVPAPAGARYISSPGSRRRRPLPSRRHLAPPRHPTSRCQPTSRPAHGPAAAGHPQAPQALLAAAPVGAAPAPQAAPRLPSCCRPARCPLAATGLASRLPRWRLNSAISG